MFGLVVCCKDVGEERAGGWVGPSQKDHLSCVRGSVEREGDSGATWLLLLLLSSPLKLFLHTGHVSCCAANRTERTHGISFRQRGRAHIYVRKRRLGA